MTLRLVGGMEDMPICTTCEGRGTIPCPVTMTTRTKAWGDNGYGPVRAPGDGCPIPCPACNGTRHHPPIGETNAPTPGWVHPCKQTYTVPGVPETRLVPYRADPEPCIVSTCYV